MSKFSAVVKKMVGLRTGRLDQKWDYDAKSSVLSAPTVADINGDGTFEIIFGTKDGKVTVIDTDAQELWSYSVHEDVGAIEEMFLDEETINSVDATPALADLTGDGLINIVFGSELGVLYCLDEKGRELWKYRTQGGIRGSPLIADVNDDGYLEVVFGTTDNFLYLLDRHGKLIEQFEQDSPVESTPGFFNGQIIFGTSDGSVISISADGHINWTHRTGGKVTAAPAFGRLTSSPVDFVIIGSTDNNLYCLDVDGELVWTYETGGAIYSQATIYDINDDGKQEIIIGSCDNNVHTISCDGERIWTYETDFWVVSKPLIADVDGDGKVEVIIGSYDHNIYVLDREGTYLLDYVPGLSGVVQQAGHYSDVMTQEPGERVGKRLWQYRTQGVIVGCVQVGDQLVVTTKTGKINSITHKD